MPFRILENLLRILALIALIVLGAFIFGVDPDILSLWGEGAFFLLLWLFLTALLGMGLLSLARRFLRSETALKGYRVSAVRQGILLGAFITFLAIAQYHSFFAWWIALLSFVFVLLIEFTLRRFSRP